MALNIHYDYRYEIIAPLDDDFEPIKRWTRGEIMREYAKRELGEVEMPPTIVVSYTKSPYEEEWSFNSFHTIRELIADAPFIYVMHLRDLEGERELGD